MPVVCISYYAEVKVLEIIYKQHVNNSKID